MLKYIGYALIAWGFLDLGLSWIGTDLYGEMGIALSDTIYPYTHWIAMGVGYVLTLLASKE